MDKTSNSSDVTSDGDALQTLSLERRAVLMPFIVYTVVLMLIGSVGNIVVCYVYSVKARRSATNIFIITLSAIDLFACCVSMPYEIYESVSPFTSRSPILCRMSMMLLYLLTLQSWIIILGIAVVRYRAICKPTTTNIDYQRLRAKRTVIVSCGLSVLLCFPVCLIYDNKTISLHYTENMTISGEVCNIQLSETHQKFLFISYSCIAGIASLFGGCTVIILNAKTVLHVFRQTKNKKMVACTLSTAPSVASCIGDDLTSVNHKVTASNTVVHILQPFKNSVTLRNRRMALQMSVVSLLFILSLWPCQIVMMTALVRLRSPRHEMSAGVMVALRSPFLSNSLHPFVYGIFTSGFIANLFEKR